MERTAKIEILEGAAAGCHKCTVDDVVGIGIVAYRIHHELLQNGRARKKYETACPELRQSGIYFLLGKNKEGRKSVYIGQAKRRLDKRTTEENGVLFRALQNHKTKKDLTIDDWDEVIMFVGPNERILRQYMDSLENQFYHKAVSTGNYEVRNGNVPTAVDHPRDVSTVIENANTMLVAMGHYVLEPLPQDKRKAPVDPTPPPEPPTPPIPPDRLFSLFYKPKGSEKAYKASGKFTNDGFVVMAGSEFCPTEIPKCRDDVRKIRRKYADKISNGRLVSDILFGSSSTAASFVCGTSRNGYIAWRDPKNKKKKLGKILAESKKG